MGLRRRAAYVLVSLGLLCAGGMPPVYSQAQFTFEKDKFYDIYYQVDNHIHYVPNEKILNTVTMGTKDFLEVISYGSFSRDPGYIAVSNIIAILPVGSAKPQIYK